MVELKDILDSGDIKELQLGKTKLVKIAEYPLEDRSPNKNELIEAFEGTPEQNLLALLRDDDSKRLFLVFFDNNNDEWYFTLMRRAKNN